MARTRQALPEPAAESPRKRTRKPNDLTGLPEAPFYPDRPVLTLSQAQFDLAWSQMVADRPRQQGARARNATEAVMVKQLSYKRAGALLGEPQTYIRSSHLWNLERLLPYIGGLGITLASASPPLVIQDVPAELHEGLRQRIEETVARYRASQQAVQPAADEPTDPATQAQPANPQTATAEPTAT